MRRRQGNKRTQELLDVGSNKPYYQLLTDTLPSQLPSSPRAAHDPTILQSTSTATSTPKDLSNKKDLSIMIMYVHSHITTLLRFNIVAYHTVAHHITSHHITSHHITSHHITSHHITFHSNSNPFLIKLRRCKEAINNAQQSKLEDLSDELPHTLRGYISASSYAEVLASFPLHLSFSFTSSLHLLSPLPYFLHACPSDSVL